MIEQQIPLEIPPGLVMNGSLMERTGKWENGNYVRFHNGIARPMGGSVAASLNIGDNTWNTAVDGPAKGMYRYWTDSGGVTVAIGRHTKMFIMRSNFDGLENSIDAITPATGLADQGDVVGWSFANLGTTLLFTNCGWPTASAFAELWAFVDGTAAATVVNSSVYRGVFVTPESFMMLIEGLNTIRWASQGTYDDLTPAVGNSAGSLDVPSPYLVISGRGLVGESLVWTTGDLWALNYVGGTLIYGLRKVGDNCGILGANNVAITNGVARWMGQGGFFEYDGYVRPLECPISEFVFGDIARDHAHRFFTVSLPQYNSIQFWYMTGAGGDYCDRFVEYNYANGTWSKGENIFRAAGVGEWPLDPTTAGLDGSGTSAPLMAGSTGTVLRLHEDASTVLQSEGPDDPATPYLRSGPVHMPDGRFCKVQKVIPDSAAVGDDVTLYAGQDPDAFGTNELEFGPYNVAVANGKPLDVRLLGRYVRYQQTLESNDSGVGVPRIGIIPGGSGR